MNAEKKIPMSNPNRSIRTSIIMSFTLLLLMVISILSVFSFAVSGGTLRDMTINNARQTIDQLKLVIENYISYMDDLSFVVQSDVNVRRFFLRDYNGEADLNIYSSLTAIKSVRPDIESIILISADGKIVTDDMNDRISYDTDWLETEWYRNAASDDMPGYISSSHVQHLILDEYPWVISLSREIPGRAAGKKLGVVLVDLNYAVIEELCRNIKLGERGYIFIINEEGEIVYHPRQQLIYSRLKTELIADVLAAGDGDFKTVVDREEVIYSSISSPVTGWTIVGVSYLDELFYNRERIAFLYILVAAVCFVVIMLISFLISKRITGPVSELRQSMLKIEDGDFSFSVQEEGSPEVAALAHDFNIAIKKIDDLFKELRNEQEQKRKQELRALQAQINPHFLYNTLDSIIWLVECGEYDDAIDMTTALAQFFRLGISKGRDIISIRSVTEHIRSYLTIQKLRYKDRLDFYIDVDESIFDFQTLKLLIQPIVENAIYHGVKAKSSPGVIRITGRREDDRIVFKIKDNGKGLSEEEIKSIEQSAGPVSGTSGIGIYNVRERIRLFFGEEYGIKYKSLEDEGTSVTITLPLITGREI